MDRRIVKAGFPTTDHSTMHTAVSVALAPPAEPTFYRRFGWVPSVRAVGRHVPAYAAFWRSEAERAMAAGAPALVVFGDSLAQGIGASSPASTYVGRLRSLLAGTNGVDGELPVVNLSRSGAKIADVIETQLPAFVASGVTPLAVVCTVGSNDIMHSFRLEAIRQAFVELIAVLPTGAVLATLPESGSRVGASMNRTIREHAAATGRDVADVGRLLTKWRGRVSGDSFHPNDAGYEVWFDAFRAALVG